MDSTGNHDSGRGGGRRSGTKPMQFMFIDSTSQGVNAKPDKAVRSFVMKSARSKKPWSTRQKSPKTETGPNADSPPDDIPPPSRARSKTGDTFHASSGPCPSPASSNTSISFFPHRKYSQPYTASHTIVCNIPQCTGEFCGQSHKTHTSLPAGNGFSVGFAYTFNCLPVPTNEKMRGLIGRFVNLFAGSLVPLDHHQISKASTTRWISKHMQSETGAPFIYALLTSSALTAAAPSKDQDKEILDYKTRAIGSINEQLLNPRTQVSDNNIAAVLILLSLEEMKAAEQSTQSGSDWSVKQMQLHLSGLKTMIQQRGGLVGLSSNLCLQTFILMHSIAHAITTFERPYTALLDSNGQPPPYDMPSFRSRPSSTRTLRLFQSLKPDPNLLDIIGNIIIFIGDLNAWIDDPKSPVDPLELQKNMSLLIYRLFDWYKLGEEQVGCERNPVDQSLCLALMVFLIASQEIRNFHVMAQMAAQKLKIALGKCLFSWGKATDLLVWTLTIGALATQGTESFVFFKENCGYAYANQGVDEMTTTHEMLALMRKCLWIGSTSTGPDSPQNLDEQAIKLWAQMGYAQEEVLDSVEEGVMSPDRVKTEDVIGGLTGDRFYRKKSES